MPAPPYSTVARHPVVRHKPRCQRFAPRAPSPRAGGVRAADRAVRHLARLGARVPPRRAPRALPAGQRRGRRCWPAQVRGPPPAVAARVARGDAVRAGDRQVAAAARRALQLPPRAPDHVPRTDAARRRRRGRARLELPRARGGVRVGFAASSVAPSSLEEGEEQKETDREADRQPDGQTDWRIGRHTDRQTDRPTDQPTDRKTINRQTDRPTDRQADRQTDRQKDNKQTDRQTDRQADRPTDRPAATRRQISNRAVFLCRIVSSSDALATPSLESKRGRRRALSPLRGFKNQQSNDGDSPPHRRGRVG